MKKQKFTALFSSIKNRVFRRKKFQNDKNPKLSKEYSRKGNKRKRKGTKRKIFAQLLLSYELRYGSIPVGGLVVLFQAQNNRPPIQRVTQQQRVFLVSYGGDTSNSNNQTNLLTPFSGKVAKELTPPPRASTSKSGSSTSKPGNGAAGSSKHSGFGVTRRLFVVDPPPNLHGNLRGTKHWAQNSDNVKFNSNNGSGPNGGSGPGNENFDSNLNEKSSIEIPVTDPDYWSNLQDQYGSGTSKKKNADKESESAQSQTSNNAGSTKTEKTQKPGTTQKTGTTQKPKNTETLTKECIARHDETTKAILPTYAKD